MMKTTISSEDEETLFFEALLKDPPEKLLVPAKEEMPSVDFAFGGGTRRDHGIWEGYLDATWLLLDKILEPPPYIHRNLIFPAMFNLRHGMEAGLKWHIRYAGGSVPKSAGHNLDVLIEVFRQTAEGMDEDTTDAYESMLELISEIAAIDPRSIAFRYSTELDGTPVNVPDNSWDLRRLRFTVEMLSLWFDHLSGDIDMSGPAYQAPLPVS